MLEEELNKRYKIDTFRAKSLEGNPLNSPVDRDINIYLPPEYFKSKDKRYPVIYFLNGYGGDNHNWGMTRTLKDKDFYLPLTLIPRKIRKQFDIDRMTTFETLDELILNKDLESFILVQPDPSLQIPQKDIQQNLKGGVPTKGSFYVNSPHTGNYMDYIIKDVIGYIDSNYRTIPDKQHRALSGGSMGGYGAIYLCCHHPDKFIAAAAGSSGNFSLHYLDLKLKMPILEKIVGEEFADQMAGQLLRDIIDTIDLISSKDQPLLPSIKRDETGKIIEMNEFSLKNWQKFDINNIIRENPNSLKQVHLAISCEISDEFENDKVSKKIHETLLEFEIEHHYDLYSDPNAAALSPHVLGLFYTTLDRIRFCLQYLPK